MYPVIFSISLAALVCNLYIDSSVLVNNALSQVGCTITGHVGYVFIGNL